MKAPYYIVAPPYDEKSAGNRVLYELASRLRVLGEDAFISVHEQWDAIRVPVPPRLDVIWLTPDLARQHHEQRRTPICIYPEITHHPHDGGLRVLYLLNHVGVMGEGADVLQYDYVLSYSASIAACSPRSDLIVHLPVSDPEYWSPDPTALRTGAVVYAGKYVDVHGQTLPADLAGATVIRRHGLGAPTRAELRELFRNSTHLYVFESTALAAEAVLCGCPVVYRTNSYFREHVGERELGLAGFTDSDRPEALAQAAAATALFRENYLVAMADAEAALRTLILETQAKARSIACSAPFPVRPLRTILPPPGPDAESALTAGAAASTVVSERERPYRPVMGWSTALKKIRAFWFQRSNGVRVSRRVSRLIQVAMLAGERGEWEASAQVFDKVLKLRPSLEHIHVQHGHALKESGQTVEAHKAYGRAVALAPDRRDPRLHLGHAAKLLGAYDEAAGHYLTLLIADLTDAEAALEFSRSLNQVEQVDRERLLLRLRARLPEDIEAQLTPAPAPLCALLAFDLSDLVGFFSHARRPTGIQRVQIETVAAALSLPPPTGMRVALCCMTHRTDDWCELSIPLFSRIVDLSRSTTGGEEAWQTACSRMNMALLLGDPIRFDAGSCLVNLGASWSLGNYFLALREAQAGHGLRYIPFVHDLIPMIHPEFHTPSLVDEFRRWLSGAIMHADHFLANSVATRRDLNLVSQDMGLGQLRRQVTVVTLNAHPPSLGGVGNAADVPEEPFVLFVGTVEPRKGHGVAFDAWSILLKTGQATPRLVCVSGRGWGSDAAYDRLRADSRLAERVTILSNVDDVTLDRLYRRSVFTIYPSLYEGWGLPVSEALARGKVVVTSNVSALPEAGGSLALYVTPGDAEDLANAVKRLIADPAARIARERRIAAEYRQRSWSDIAHQVMSEASAVARSPRTVQEPPATVPGRCYRLGFAATLQNDGERMRIGIGWFSPEYWGNRVRAVGGTLRFSLAAGDGSSRCRYVLAVLLRGAGSGRRHFSVVVEDHAQAQGWLEANERRWVFVRFALTGNDTLRATIAGRIENAEEHASSRPAPAGGGTIGVEGWSTIAFGEIARSRSVLGDLLREGARDEEPRATA